MKTLIATLALAAATLVSQMSLAQDRVYRERVVADETNPVALKLDATTVRCSSLGYGRQELKVSVPDLGYLALFNHVNFGETLPCMSAGPCTDDNKPEDLIGDGSNPTETVNVRVQRVETVLQRFVTKLCTRTVEERITATIRGKIFKHVRQINLGDQPLEACDKL